MKSFMSYLESNGELNRKIEFLPSDKTMRERSSNGGKALTRPEVAVLVAYAKNSIYNRIADLKISKSPYFTSYLNEYFPSTLKEKHQNAIDGHILKDEIILTSLTNSFVNIMGCCFFHSILRKGKHSAEDIICHFAAVKEILDMEKYWG